MKRKKERGIPVKEGFPILIGSKLGDSLPGEFVIFSINLYHDEQRVDEL